ncbi:hypothetical protein M8C21_033752, partial [Ambrosia artemisiifolia]
RKRSGKSRLIEALVGRVFLPNVPTRTKFYDFNQIRTEIQAETDREAGGGFSDKELHLNIFSPNVLDVTFVDLPGIPVGDDGIEADRVRTIIMPYVNCPCSLILAVTPATADIANSDAVQIAVTADPDCQRTIGVITKTVEAAGKREVFPLRFSYVCVVNRSQEVELLLGKAYSDWGHVSDAVSVYDQLISSHPNDFRGYLAKVHKRVSERCGVPFLAKRMDRLLVQHSKNYLRLMKIRMLESRAIAASGSLAKIA